MQKTKTIYSLRLCQFLLEHDCHLIDIVDSPFKKGFKSWRFKDDEHLQECIALFMKEREKDS